MTTPEHTSAPDVIEPADANAAPNEKTRAIPTFSFPFKPGELAASRKDQPYYRKLGQSNHEKRPGAAPAGTRRSMGKR